MILKIKRVSVLPISRVSVTSSGNLNHTYETVYLVNFLEGAGR